MRLVYLNREKNEKGQFVERETSIALDAMLFDFTTTSSLAYACNNPINFGLGDNMIQVSNIIYIVYYALINRQGVSDILTDWHSQAKQVLNVHIATLDSVSRSANRGIVYILSHPLFKDILMYHPDKLTLSSGWSLEQTHPNVTSLLMIGLLTNSHLSAIPTTIADSKFLFVLPKGS